MRWSDYFWGFHLAVRGFTDHAVGVLSEARHQAAIRRDRDTEPEHVLLALAMARRQPAAMIALERLGVDLRRDLDQLAALLRCPTGASSDKPRFSPETKQLLAHARLMAKQLGQNYIGTEHLVLGLLGSDSCPAADYLRARGATKDRFLEELIGLLNKSWRCPKL